jgi:hypothetical protein
MSTICADELFPGEARLRDRETARRAPAATVASTPRADGAAGHGPVPATRRRYEDFEARSSHLDDLLSGQVFPRIF